MSGVSQPYAYQYETVAASATAQVLGGTGAVGDYVHRLIISVVKFYLFQQKNRLAS